MANQILSSDSHVLEPADLWVTRMQPKFRDRAPRLIHEHDGKKGDFLACDPLPPFNPTTLGNAGIPPEQQEEFAMGGYASCRPGAWDPVERLKDMDMDGLGAEIFYCGYGMFLHQHPDDEFQRDAHRAYNDWAAEYASYDPKRLLPIASISMTDPEKDLEEVIRTKNMGFKGIFISNAPLRERRYDNPMWEKFWSAVEEFELPVNVHVQTMQRGDANRRPNRLINAVIMMLPAFESIVEMITGGVLERHPNLKLVSVENDIGWIPNFLKRMDWYSYRYRTVYTEMKMPAGDYWRRQVYATFQDDVPGVRCRDMIGVSNLMWGSDYPHFDSTFPNSQKLLEENFAGVPEDEREMMTGGNMKRLYNLE